MQTWLPDGTSFLAGVDGAVAISTWLSEWATGEARRIHRRVDVVEIPIVVDTGEQVVRSPVGDERLFVYSASNEYMHDLAFVFRAMRRVWERFPEARLMVTGMHPQRAAAVASGEGILSAVDDGRVKICGFLERPDLLSAYQQAAALLIPLHNDVRSRARFPSKIGEYLASGRPVVTCRVGEIERFLRDGETAYVAAADDVAAFSDRMVEVLDDVPRAAEIGAAGRRVAEERFSYGPQGLRLGQLLERVCRAGSRSLR
jgi:glycosyltransferase involved in cell wall biosynthesis